MNEDLIRRQAAINTVFSMCCRWNTDDPNDLKNMLMLAFQELPSAEPSPENCWGCNCPKMVPSATQTNAPNALNALDCVSRQAVIDMLAAMQGRCTSKAALIQNSKIWQQIKDLPSAQPEPQWIPVTERLPPKYIGEWLCCTDDGRVMALPYDTPGDGTKECVFYKWDDNGYYYEVFNVVAWMPLPEPWKGEADD